MTSAPRRASGGGASTCRASVMATSRASRGSVLDAGDDAAGTPGQADGGAAGEPLPVMRTEGDEPAVCGVLLRSGGAAGDGAPAFGADAFRALLRSHRTAFTGSGSATAGQPHGSGHDQRASYRP